jgi:2-C-methyl-D-erythritol 4-phosphate cytidylyltransferase
MQLAVVIPAAGIGSRMQAAIPKQYLSLAGKTVLEQTLGKMLAFDAVAKVVVAIAPHDGWFSQLTIANDPRIETVIGGTERANSVLHALAALDASEYPWVMVHDAARPLVHIADLAALWQFCLQHKQGAILATPVRDTMKRSTAARPSLIDHTVCRQQLWHALTPQLFPTVQLRQHLQHALAQGVVITDEASAMEWAGEPVHLVQGRADNIKITQPEDLALAQFYLEQTK